MYVSRFNRFLLYNGYGAAEIAKTKIHMFCKIVHEFALEYRTERDKILQRRQKATQQERKLSYGKIPDYVSGHSETTLRTVGFSNLGYVVTTTILFFVIFHQMYRCLNVGCISASAFIM